MMDDMEKNGIAGGATKRSMDITKQQKADRWKESKEYIEKNKSLLGDKQNEKHFGLLCSAIETPVSIDSAKIEKALQALKSRASNVPDLSFKNHLRIFCSNSELIYKEVDEYSAILLELGYIKPKKTRKKANTTQEKKTTPKPNTQTQPKNPTEPQPVPKPFDRREINKLKYKIIKLTDSKKFWSWFALATIVLVIAIVIVDKVDDWIKPMQQTDLKTAENIQPEQESSPVTTTHKTEPTPKIEYFTIRERRYYQWDESNIYKVDISFRCPTDIEGAPLLPLWEGWLHDKELRNDINRIAEEWSKDRYQRTVNYKQLHQEICKSSEYIDGILLHAITLSCFGKELLHEPTAEQKRDATSADLTVREQIYIPHQLLGLKQTIRYKGEVEGLITTLTRYIYYYIPWERTLEYTDIFTLSKQQLADKLQARFIDQYNGSIRIDWERFINDPNVRVELQKSEAVLNLSTYATAYDGDAPMDDMQPSVLIELPYKESPDLWGTPVKRIFLNQ